VIWSNEPDVVTAIRGALERSEVVSSVVLGGSRARGMATGLSDWDLYVEGEPRGLVEEIPALVASFGPLAAFWEPLSEQAGYMVVLDGPIKIDLFPIGARVRSSHRGG
jgi:predicted nucleotidyltransferase